MPPLLEHRLIVVTGKGGAGKTTIATALGLLAAGRGLHTIVAEVGQQDRLPALFGLDGARPGVETPLQDNLHSISIDPDLALLEWLQVLGGRISGRLLATSSTFQYFAAAAPGAKELVTMVKVAELIRARRRASAAPYELVVLDAPATGHALGMLQSPVTFGAIARVGPIAAQTRRVQQLLQDGARTAYVAVAPPAELGVTETLELRDLLRRQLGRELDAVIVNGVLPRRFSAEELALLEQPELRDGGEGAAAVMRAAAEAARAVHERARFQRNQLARLRRAGLPTVTIPFRFSADLDLGALREIASLLERRLS